MSLWTSQWNIWQSRPHRVRKNRAAHPNRSRLQLEQLSDRIVPAVTASFDAGTGVLTVLGDNAANGIEVTSDISGNLFVNEGSVAIQGGTPTTANTTQIVVKGKGGNDDISIDPNLTIATRLNAGAGNDTMNGGGGIDTFEGKAGNDQMDGNKGNDIANMGDGNDTFTWDPGDGSDTIEGQDGKDTMQFNGNAGDEFFEASAVGKRLLFFREQGNINMDVNGLEVVNVAAKGGADEIVIHDLKGTDVSRVNLDLSNGAGSDDGAVDLITIDGTEQRDNLKLEPSKGGALLRGMAADVHFSNALNDNLQMDLLGGNDELNVANGLGNSLNITAFGGDGNDKLIGGDGNETFAGNDGDDTLKGRGGNDELDGDDGIDTIDGGAGDDLAEEGENVTNVP